MKKVVIRIAGHSCVGKSTIGELLAQKFPRSYNLSYDRLKWGVTNYHRDKHKKLVKELTLGYFEVLCKKSLPIILDAFITSRNDFNKYEKIAKKYKYKLYFFELVAETSDLLERFKDRINSVKRQGRKISIMDKNLYKKNLELKYYLPKETISFNTSKRSKEEIVSEMVRIIKK